MAKDPYGRTQETRKAWEAIKPEDREEMSLEEIAKVRGLDFNTFVNAGTSSIILPAVGEGGGHGSRLEPGDTVQGAYYEKCLKHARGLQRLCFVDDERLDTLAKQKRIRDGEEYPDWVKEAKSRLGTKPRTDQSATDQFMEEDPADRLLRVSAENRPHAADEK